MTGPLSQSILLPTGSDYVDWLLKNVDVKSRRAAEELAQRTLEIGFIEHVVGNPYFKESNFYRIGVRKLLLPISAPISINNQTRKISCCLLHRRHLLCQQANPSPLPKNHLLPPHTDLPPS